jgi:2-(3-amino-3-carboxypropyl)histidine synthase
MESRTIKGVKTLFVPARSEIDLSEKDISKIKIKENKIGIVFTAQTQDLIKDIKGFLEKKGKEVHVGGQMVGCNASNAIKIKSKVDALLFIGSGMFHPIELIEKTKIKKYYKFNPSLKSFSKIDETEIKQLEKKKQAKLAKYFSSKRIGIIVTTKPGQENLNIAKSFAKKCGKEAYIFLDDHIDVNKLEDFPDIEFWVNTGCPRLEEKGIIALKDILNAKSYKNN